jgi:two-component system phosphate regulon sensor histidine kinase PhoR
MKKKLRLWEINVFILLTTVSTILIIIVISFYNFNRSLYSNYKEILIQNSLLLENQVSEIIDSPEKIHKLCENTKNDKAQITVVLRNGVVIGDSKKNQEELSNQLDNAEIHSALNGQIKSYIRFNETTRFKSLYVAIPIHRNTEIVGVLLNSVPISVIDNQMWRLYLSVIFGSLFIVIVAFYYIFKFAKKINKPITEMSECAEHFAQGQFSKKISIPDIFELEVLAISLNKMASQLDEKIILIDQQKNEIDAVLASMAESVLAVDHFGKIIRYNEAFQKLFGLSESVTGKDFAEIVRNKDLEDYITTNLTINLKPEEKTIYLIKQSLYMKANGSALIDAMGEKYGAVIVLSDITRMKQLDQIRQEFVSNASHEIRTPITSIKGFVETILSNGLDDKEDTKRFLNIVDKQSDRLIAIINDLLLLSSLEEGGSVPRSEVNVIEIFLEALQTCSFQAQQKDIQINLNCENSLKALVNFALVEQAIVNLLMNAIAYSPAKSTVTISAEIVSGKLKISVKDNGIGIPANHLERLFERFYRVDKSRSRKNGGTGLGLSIVKHIAQVHGGTVEVESTPNKGSAFYIYFPI